MSRAFRLTRPGLRLLHLDSVDSTNRVAADAARAGEPEGLVVLAERQTAGRGRQGRRWLNAEECGLTLSLLRRPKVPPTRAWAWTLIAGLAALDLAPPGAAWLKWPNDLMIGERKAGGILCELVTRGMNLDAVVVGIGLNLRTPPGGWPEEITDRAADLSALDPALADPQVALERLCAAFVELEANVLSRGPAPLLRAAEAAMAPMLGRVVRVDTRTARVVGIGHNGALRLMDAAGEFDVLAGDVHLGG